MSGVPASLREREPGLRCRPCAGGRAGTLSLSWRWMKGKANPLVASVLGLRRPCHHTEESEEGPADRARFEFQLLPGRPRNSVHYPTGRRQTGPRETGVDRSAFVWCTLLPSPTPGPSLHSPRVAGLRDGPRLPSASLVPCSGALSSRDPGPPVSFCVSSQEHGSHIIWADVVG